METIVRFYKPGLPINLYDSKQHQFCHGVLVFLQDQVVEPVKVEAEVETKDDFVEVSIGEKDNLTIWDASTAPGRNIPFQIPQINLDALRKITHFEDIRKIVESYLREFALDTYVSKSSKFIQEKYAGVITQGKTIAERVQNDSRISNLNFSSNFGGLLGKVSFSGITQSPSPTIVLAPSIPPYKFFLRGLAIGLLFVSLFSITASLLPIADALLIYSRPKTELYNEANHKDPNVYSNNFLLTEDELFKNNDFRVIIPKIDLESEVIANVDSSNEQRYEEELKKGVAHANGSYLPGQSGPILLFAHSTDTVFNIEQYNAKFFAVKDLEIGDEIQIAFKGKTYKYSVKEKKIINPDQLDVIRQSQNSLILSTCWPPGTNWQRLIVFADEVTEPVSTPNP